MREKLEKKLTKRILRKGWTRVSPSRRTVQKEEILRQKKQKLTREQQSKKLKT